MSDAVSGHEAENNVGYGRISYADEGYAEDRQPCTTIRRTTLIALKSLWRQTEDS